MIVPTFRKKPIEISAIQYAGEGNFNPRGGSPEWIWEALERGILFARNETDPLYVQTLEGELIVSPGDWIIRGVKGELYPCKPGIFEETYELAD